MSLFLPGGLAGAQKHSVPIALVVSGQGASTTSDGFTTDAIDTTGANFIALFLGTGNTNVGAVSDSKLNTWTPLIQKEGGFSNRWAQIFYAENLGPTKVGTGHTFSVDGSSNFPSILVAAFSGVGSPSFDVQNGNENGAHDTCSTGSVTPSVDNEVLIAALNFDNSSLEVPTIDSGFGILQTISDASFGHQCSQLAYLIETTKTTKNPTFSWTTGNLNVAVIASFKPS